MLAEAGDYPWSSYDLRLQPGTNWLVSDPCFATLGQTQQRLRGFRCGVIPAEQLQLKVIRSALQQGQLTGTERFHRPAH